MPDETDSLLPRPLPSHEQIQQFVDGVGVVIGRIDRGDEGMKVRVKEYGNRLIYEYNSHGRNDHWQLTFFIPQSDFDLLSKMNIELIDESQKEASCILPIKKHKVRSCLIKNGKAKCVNDDIHFKIYKATYTNPFKTGPKSHWLAVSVTTATHVILSYKFKINIFAKEKELSKSPPFWDMVVIGFFVMKEHFKEVKEETFRKMWAILLSALDEKEKSLEDMLYLCQEINNIKKMESICDHYNDSNDTPLLQCPLFTLLFIMTCKEDTLKHIEPSMLTVIEQCKPLFKKFMKPSMDYRKTNAWESECLPFAIQKVTGLELKEHHLTLLIREVMGIVSRMCCLQVNTTDCDFLALMEVGCLLRSAHV